MIGIYKITNQLNGKVYIGQSIDIEERWRQHKRAWRDTSRKALLYEAIRKDGLENFLFEIIEECPKERLNEREKFWIREYNSLEDGYNMSTIENLQRKIPSSLAEEIIKEIQISDLTSIELARKYNVSRTWISLVNQGKLWHKEGLIYPLRNFQKITEKHFCVDCGKEISSHAKRCNLCENKRREVNFQQCHPISREQLKDLIRNKTFVEIAKIYNVSDNAIKKWCDKFNLPRKKKEIKSYSDEEWSKI